MNIHLLHTNDVHSQLENYMRIGTSLRNLRNRLRKSGELVFTFDIGDVVDRIRPETEATLGRVNAKLLKSLQVDGWVFGNNEGLTIPPGHWAEFVKAADTITFGTNLRTPEGSPFPFFHDCYVYTCQGIRLGTFGLTPYYDKPYEHLAVDVLDPFECARAAVDILNTQGVDVVVVLSHLGSRVDRELASRIPGIDVILGGHTHELMKEAERVNKTWIYQAGKHARAFGHTVIQFDVSARQVSNVESQFVQVNPKADMDGFMKRAYEEELPNIARQLAQPVTRLEVSLPAHYREESVFANLLVDAMTDAAPCDLGLMMSGALTASLLAGNIHYADVHAACQTPTKPLLITLKGSDIYAILKKTLLPDYTERMGYGYGFRGSVIGRLSISGATVEIETQSSEMSTITSIWVGGQPLDLERSYRVMTCEYLWLSGVYSEIQNGTDVDILAPLVRDLLVRHLSDRGHVERAMQPRWMIRSTNL